MEISVNQKNVLKPEKGIKIPEQNPFRYLLMSVLSILIRSGKRFLSGTARRIATWSKGNWGD